eukprot:scaffold13644_cov179-Alexandrium_tamarense.AAC.1
MDGSAADGSGVAKASSIKDAVHTPNITAFVNTAASDHAGVPNGGTKASPEPEQEEDLLLSHIVPPSHVLSDGRFILLPPPTSLDHSAFFERAVAANRLISADADTSTTLGTKSKRGGGDCQAESTSDRDKKKSKKSADTPFVHPLAIASARLRGKGLDEMSKAINLGGLVVGGEYFGLTNVVNQRPIAHNNSDARGVSRDGGKGKDGKTDDNGNAVSSDAASSGEALDESILLDQRLRSKYVLRRRQSQYDNAATILTRHERRLSSSLSARRILDTRLRSLRRRWRLVAPEHGTRTVGPVRPKEVVAVDVEVYDRDRLGGGSRAVDDPSQTPGHLGRIARRVP